MSKKWRHYRHLWTKFSSAAREIVFFFMDPSGDRFIRRRREKLAFSSFLLLSPTSGRDCHRLWPSPQCTCSNRTRSFSKIRLINNSMLRLPFCVCVCLSPPKMSFQWAVRLFPAPSLRYAFVISWLAAGRSPQ